MADEIENSDKPDVETPQDRPLIETRSANVDDVKYGERIITVLAAPYEQPAQVFFKNDIWNEVFTRSAFHGFDASMRRVPASACLDVPDKGHSNGKLVGRVREAFTDREQGLVTDVKISRTPEGDAVLELAKDDAIAVSVGFMVKTPYRDQELDLRSRTRRINRAFIDHLAFVVEGAYPGAKVLATRGVEAPTEEELRVSETPNIDWWMEDPIIQWAFSRSKNKPTAE